jgi:thymidine phosphorylase
MIPQEVILAKRNGETLPPLEIYEFIKALAENRISEGQVAAFAMAVWFNGMSAEETVALTLAMRDSGDVLDWPDPGKPVGDKHSTGGIGDNVSLMLAPIVAACGLAVPMISGRGLGHTGGTLDKLESIPGYNIHPSAEHFRDVVKRVGCAIVGQTGQIAPADKRLYAIRDVTATVDSVPLITASILSKKLAAGLQSLTMDVKTGNGAFMQSMEDAETLARSIVDVANGADVKTSAIITDMSEPLADCAGNAVEVAHAMEFLSGNKGGTRIHEVVMTFAAHMLVNSGLAGDLDAAAAKASYALSSGRALEVFGEMVGALGGPEDFAENWKSHLPVAPVIVPIAAPRSGYISAFKARDVGLAVIGLRGGRLLPDDGIDHRTGFSGILPIGSRVENGDTIAFVHAQSDDAAKKASEDFLDCVAISEAAVPRGAAILKLIS